MKHRKCLLHVHKQFLLEIFVHLMQKNIDVKIVSYKHSSTTIFSLPHITNVIHTVPTNCSKTHFCYMYIILQFETLRLKIIACIFHFDTLITYCKVGVEKYVVPIHKKSEDMGLL